MILTIKGIKYFINREEVLQLQEFLLSGKGLNKKPYVSFPLEKNEEWCKWSKNIPKKTLSILEEKMVSIEKSTRGTEYFDRIIESIISQSCEEFLNHLFSCKLDFIESICDIDLPKVMWSLAGINTISGGGTKGREVGRGELVIPFLFKEGSWNSNNSEYDVLISKDFWHVKEIASYGDSIRMGKKTYSGTKVQEILGRLGMSSNELSWDGSIDTSLKRNLALIKKEFLPTMTDIDIVRKIQDMIDDDMRKMAINEARGVCFYLPSKDLLRFVEKEKCYCSGVTQASHKVTMRSNSYLDKMRK